LRRLSQARLHEREPAPGREARGRDPGTGRGAGCGKAGGKTQEGGEPRESRQVVEGLEGFGQERFSEEGRQGGQEGGRDGRGLRHRSGLTGGFRIRSEMRMSARGSERTFFLPGRWDQRAVSRDAMASANWG